MVCYGVLLLFMGFSDILWRILSDSEELMLSSNEVKSLTMKISAKTHARLKLMASIEGLTQSQLIEKMVALYEPEANEAFAQHGLILSSQAVTLDSRSSE